VQRRAQSQDLVNTVVKVKCHELKIFLVHLNNYHLVKGDCTRMIIHVLSSSSSPQFLFEHVPI
jgi:hypothetical protein